MFPLPSDLLKFEKKTSTWSDSDSPVDKENQFPKSKAVRGKFVYDPEHGGGRRRRDKHLPKQKMYTENTDKIGEGQLSFNARIGLDFKLRSDSPELLKSPTNPFEVVQDIDMKENE